MFPLCQSNIIFLQLFDLIIYEFLKDERKQELFYQSPAEWPNKCSLDIHTFIQLGDLLKNKFIEYFLKIAKSKFK